MKCVLDASVIVKWFLDDDPEEKHIKEAKEVFDRVQQGEDEVVQPVHWRVEVLSVIVRKEPGKVEEAIKLLDLLAFSVMDNWELHIRAAQLSQRYNHHLFDTLYHAVALESGARLVTADRKYARKAMGEGAMELLG
tara:strand:- start:33 stop:440 length:408 start_codon:yes stop_codon:yes gene_type:complete